MKKIVRILGLMSVFSLTLGLWSCGDDDKPVSPEELPTPATAFVQTYYPNVEILNTVRDDNKYDVTLSNGHEIEFDRNGAWLDVDAPLGLTVPTGFYPSDIDVYIKAIPDAGGVNEISKEKYGYDVETVNGLDLMFSAIGTYLGAED
ncbi:MAG: PepSY-like domain-containing protein [Muribaculaceae bacterium]|nr:PepSY-like domain-containing protein [Muribaculaceae bacterium]